MKKTLLFFCLLFTLVSKAQQPVVFMPQGAKWHYNFKAYNFEQSLYVIKNKTVEYAGDTVINNESVKILHHPYFYRHACGPCSAPFTYIKQHGDTVFMKNHCLLDWQILYNFATPVGGQWSVVTTSAIFIIKVNNTQTTTINGV